MIAMLQRLVGRMVVSRHPRIERGSTVTHRALELDVRRPGPVSSIARGFQKLAAELEILGRLNCGQVYANVGWVIFGS